MQTAQFPQIGIVEGLHAERHAVDAGAASTLDGLASSVISAPGSIRQSRAISSRMAATVVADISDGVPPPKKMLPTLLPGTSSAKWRSSRR